MAIRFLNNIKFHFYLFFNGEVSFINITLDGTMCPSKKLVRFVLFEKATNLNKTHQLITGMVTAI